MKRLKKIRIVLAIAVVIILVAITIRLHNKAQAKEMEEIVIDNLTTIDASKQQWLLEERHPDSNNVPTWTDITPYLSGGIPSPGAGHGPWEYRICEAESGFALPRYPPGAVYTIRPIGESPLCSYCGRTLALYGLSVQVRNASNYDTEGFQVFEIYQQTNEAGNVSKEKFRPSGSIVGANVAVEDKEGHWTNTVTDDEGMASVNTYQPVTIVVSKDGFLASSNFIQDGYEYNQTVLLQKKLE
jgi:hypothetical protein